MGLGRRLGGEVADRVVGRVQDRERGAFAAPRTGGLLGRDAVRDYWRRQFEAISSQVEPEGFTEEPDGSITVDVHAVVHDAGTGELLSDSRIRHRYRLEGGLITRMDVLEA